MYFVISIFINFFSSLFTFMNETSMSHGGQQAILEIFGFWMMICIAVYTIYFIIPEFNKNWEKIAGLVLPSIILSLVLTIEPSFIYLICINIILNVVFIWHFTKKLKSSS